MSFRSGRHFLQIPGPTNVPDRVLRAIDHPTIDHRGPEFAQLGLEVLEGLRHVFRTDGPVVVYPSSGTGAWEAALVNALSPGDRVLAFVTSREEGLESVFARHARHAAATRAAVGACGLEVLAADEREYSGSLTAVLCDDADEAGTLCGVEMGLRAAGVEIEPGVGAALELLEAASVPA